MDFDRLNRTDLHLYSYRKALALIKSGQYAAARPLIKSIASVPEYKDAAIFYTAYLDYVAGDLDRAYNGFLKVPEGTPGLEPAYYLTQIDYKRGEYDRVIETGRRLLSRASDPELIPETNRVVGLSYFKNHDYAQARTYLLKYEKETSSDSLSNEAIYALGVCDYEAADYQHAAERFGRLTDLNSDLGQSAWLYIGQCDVKSGNPDAAAIAFEKAARMNFDKNVTETALYNYAAAITRGGKIPFSSSVDLLERFIKSYPDSEYAPKIEEYLATAYYNERDYTKALGSISAIRNPSSKILAAKQKILFSLGTECVSNNKYKEGAGYLRQAISLASHDRDIAAQSELWLGDALYAQMDYKGAKKAYSNAVSSIKSGANKTLALYDLAYSSYMLNDYTTAAKEFSRALDASPALPASLRDDATIRRADCLYYTGDYNGAKNLYSEALKRSAADSDYAAYRHAVMLGLGNDINGKLKELAEIESRFPDSRWLPTAMLEKALTYESLGRTPEATKSFRELSSRFPDAAQARKALLNLALADSRTGKGEAAAQTYKEIITKWPSSDEAAMANEDLKKYYASQGSLRDYADFLKTVPGARQLDANEMEELAFEGAEIAYTDNISNIQLLRNYVRDYPDGKYLAQALLDIAMAQEASKDYTGAEETLTRLIADRPHSPQVPEALLMKAEILENNLEGRTKDALIAYRELERKGGQEFAAEAVSGVMRTTSDPAERVNYARRARAMGGLSADRVEETSLYEAEALLALGRDGEAAGILNSLAANPASLAGAKAAVSLARHYLDKGNYIAAEEVALAFTDAGTPHQYWLAKGYIALADAYHGQGKTYLGKEYLQSLQSNYPGKESDIKAEISKRLKEWK